MNNTQYLSCENTSLIDLTEMCLSRMDIFPQTNISHSVGGPLPVYAFPYNISKSTGDANVCKLYAFALRVS